MRQPEPWYRTSKGAWYVQVAGQKIRKGVGHGSLHEGRPCMDSDSRFAVKGLSLYPEKSVCAKAAATSTPRRRARTPTPLAPKACGSRDGCAMLEYAVTVN